MPPLSPLLRENRSGIKKWKRSSASISSTDTSTNNGAKHDHDDGGTKNQLRSQILGQYHISSLFLWVRIFLNSLILFLRRRRESWGRPRGRRWDPQPARASSSPWSLATWSRCFSRIIRVLLDSIASWIEFVWVTNYYYDGLKLLLLYFF